MWCIASGDDVVAWVSERNLPRLQESLNTLTTTNKDLVGSHGIGQIVVDIKVAAWWDNEFCSKWFYHTGPPSLESWVCTRDLKKTFATKMFYKGDQSFIHLNPVFHAFAIFEGICSEVNSIVIQKNLCLPCPSTLEEFRTR